jgi:putative ABC transport system permease protein
MLIAGYETKGYQPYDFRLVEGRRIAGGPEVMVERNWARDRGYDVGDRVRVAGPTGRTKLPIVGIFKLTSSLNVGGLGYAAMPLPAARRLFDQPNGWMQISIVADNRGDVGPLKKRVEHVVGSGVNVQTPGEVSDQISDQLGGLNIVLYFFSGVALFVGGFLILNSFNMTVLQRMRELGMLRTLGASRGMAMASVLTEALVLGIVGTVLGLGLGLLRSPPVVSASSSPCSAPSGPRGVPVASRRSGRFLATLRCVEPLRSDDSSSGWPCSSPASGSGARSGSAATARRAASRPTEGS